MQYKVVPLTGAELRTFYQEKDAEVRKVHTYARTPDCMGACEAASMYH
jgi:hypothetical protein